MVCPRGKAGHTLGFFSFLCFEDHFQLIVTPPPSPLFPQHARNFGLIEHPEMSTTTKIIMTPQAKTTTGNLQDFGTSTSSPSPSSTNTWHMARSLLPGVVANPFNQPPLHSVCLPACMPACLPPIFFFSSLCLTGTSVAVVPPSTHPQPVFYSLTSSPPCLHHPPSHPNCPSNSQTSLLYKQR